GSVDRFRRERHVDVLSGHPAIIQIYELLGSDDDTVDPCIVMEYFDGPPLDVLLKQGPLAPVQVISVVRQCADGLRRAHANNVVHRDIKPGNIMMSAAGEVKILDFGVAKLRDAKKDLTGEAVLGTPYYMSPEQATGYAIDARSDIYSLGITAFHLLTGRKPFEAKNKVDVMLMQVKAPLPDLTQIVPCDVRIAAIVGKMCAKKPAERYQSCDELIAAIDSLPRSIGGGQPDAPAQAERTRLLSQPPRGVSPAARRSPPLPPATSGPWLGVTVGDNRAGESWGELFSDGRKRAHVSVDPALSPSDDQLTLPLSERHAARLRELSNGQHTVDVWIYRRGNGTDNPVPLAAGELVVR